MKKALATLLLGAVLLASPSCFAVNHTVGGGPTGAGTTERRVWYALWGLVPLDSSFDSRNLAGDATSYRVTSEWTAVDILINLLTGWVSFLSRTVTVEK